MSEIKPDKMFTILCAYRCGKCVTDVDRGSTSIFYHPLTKVYQHIILYFTVSLVHIPTFHEMGHTHAYTS